MDVMEGVLEGINRFVWGVPALLLIVGVGLYYTVRTGFAQFSMFPAALRHFAQMFRRKNRTGENSPYRALCTALAATVGTGNLAGVAGAIAIGGPGAVFWMWICALLGMITKFAEAVLAVCCRHKNGAGEYVGGPMYMIRDGMGKRWAWLGSLYCAFGVVAALGAGNATQVNAVVGGINGALEGFGILPTPLGNALIGLAVAVLVLITFLGGASRIGQLAEKLVPLASVVYILLSVGVLILRWDQVPRAISAIVEGAFQPGAVTGGAVGSFMVSLRVGASRGVFTNEAGMGTASIAHASASVAHPVQQGFMGIMEVFIDTIVICTMTALVILCSGTEIPYGSDIGVSLTSNAFAGIYGQWVHVVIAAALCCFAFATILGWGLYGARCAQYLFGERAWLWFVLAQAATSFLGAILGTGTVWLFSETVNGLMAIPNLIVLLYLSPTVLRSVREYKDIQDRLSDRKPRALGARGEDQSVKTTVSVETSL